MRSKEELIAWLKGEIEHYGERLLYEDIIKHLSQPEPTSGQYDDLIEFMGAMYGYVPDGYEEEYNQVVEALRQANEPRFDVLKHLREGGKVIDKDRWVTWRDGHKWMSTDPYGITERILADGQITLLLQLVQGDHFELYEEPTPKLEDGRYIVWYRPKVGARRMEVADYADGLWFPVLDGEEVNAYRNQDAIEPILNEHGNPKECK